ncbi:hypothetical protein Lser_V15G43687 [Lactuca serriola]
MDAPSFPLPTLTAAYFFPYFYLLEPPYLPLDVEIVRKSPNYTLKSKYRKIEDGEEVAVEEVEDEQSKMEGMASIALLLDGSISGRFVQLPESVYYQMGQSRLFVSTSYLSVKQPTTPTPPSANPKPSSKDIRSSSFPFD